MKLRPSRKPRSRERSKLLKIQNAVTQEQLKGMAKRLGSLEEAAYGNTVFMEGVNDKVAAFERTHLKKEDFGKRLAPYSRRLDNIEVELDRRAKENVQLKLQVDYLLRVSAADVEPKTCQDLSDLGLAPKSGEYSIDPDGVGIGEPPITVYCDMDQEKQTGVTMIGHNFVNKLVAVEKCQESGCHTTHITYNAPFEQVRKLMGRSATCSQSIQYTCPTSSLLSSASSADAPNNGTRSWWIGSDGVSPNYFREEGNKTETSICGCLGKPKCRLRDAQCICDPAVSRRENDTSFLEMNDKDSLPVVELRLAGGLEDRSQGEHFTLGQLKCSGSKTMSQLHASRSNDGRKELGPPRHANKHQPFLRPLPPLNVPTGKELWELGKKTEWKVLEKVLEPFGLGRFLVTDAASELHLAEIRSRFDGSRSSTPRCVTYWSDVFCVTGEGVLHAMTGAYGGDDGVDLARNLLALGIDPDKARTDKCKNRPSHECGEFARPNLARILSLCRPNLTVKKGCSAGSGTPLHSANAGYKNVNEYEAIFPESERVKIRPQVVKIWEDVEKNGFPSIAKLAYLKEWEPLQNLCRRRMPSEDEAKGKYEGKTAVEWAEHYWQLGLAAELRYLLAPPSEEVKKKLTALGLLGAPSN